MNLRKALLHGVLLLALFFGAFLGLSRVPWTKLFGVKEKSVKFEKELGDAYYKLLVTTQGGRRHPHSEKLVQSLVTEICKKNDLDCKDVRTHVVQNSQINAFALPGGHIVFYSELLARAKSSEEIAAVLSHELAHLQLHHVMQKFVKEVGTATLVGLVTGRTRGAGEGAGQLLRLSTLSFDRGLESEADDKAVEYLAKAGIAADHFCSFLLTMQSEVPKEGALVWVSTHPNPDDRVDHIIEKSKELEVEGSFTADGSAFSKMKDEIRELNGEADADPPSPSP